MNPQKRKAPAFKPPRPINVEAQAAPPKTGARVGNASTVKKSMATASSKTTSRAAQKSRPEVESDNQNELMDEDEDAEDAVEAVKPAVPPKLLARLIHDNFEDQDVKIGKEAMEVIGEYMKTFVREAMARANHELKGSDAVLDDNFLQVEHLEKIAPQLLLDF